MRLCYGPLCYPKKIKYDISELTEFHSKMYCENCLPIVYGEYRGRTDLVNALRSEYDTATLPGMVLSQIKNFHKSGMSYQGMLNTFDYIHEVKGKTFERQYGIGLIKFFYDEGNKYESGNHKKMADNKQSVKTSVVTINLPDKKQTIIKKMDEKGLLDD